MTPPVRSSRPLLARIGIAALTLFSPGLGLMRVGRVWAGLFCLVLPGATMLAMIAVFVVAPVPSFSGFAIGVAVVAMGGLVVYVAALVVTWRSSAVQGTQAWWSRWYTLLTVGMLTAAMQAALVDGVHGFYKPYWAPSFSMMPTIHEGDQFLADALGRPRPRIGDVVLFQAHDAVRVARVAGLGGDVVAMRAGIPIVNGVAARQRDAGTMTIADVDGTMRAIRRIERLPREVGSHVVLDQGRTVLDEMPAIRVPRGAVFLLGDHRDRSADSRAPRAINGVGTVPATAIVGYPLFVFWSADRARIGLRINP